MKKKKDTGSARYDRFVHAPGFAPDDTPTCPKRSLGALRLRRYLRAGLALGL
jgi:hypothetical protein